jgi:adenosine deaminase
MFGNSLADEYFVLHRDLGFSRADVSRLILQAIETSWLPQHRKQELLDRFKTEMTSGIATMAERNAPLPVAKKRGPYKKGAKPEAV